MLPGISERQSDQQRNSVKSTSVGLEEDSAQRPSARRFAVPELPAKPSFSIVQPPWLLFCLFLNRLWPYGSNHLTPVVK